MRRSRTRTIDTLKRLARSVGFQKTLHRPNRTGNDRDTRFKTKRKSILSLGAGRSRVATEPTTSGCGPGQTSTPARSQTPRRREMMISTTVSLYGYRPRFPSTVRCDDGDGRRRRRALSLCERAPRKRLTSILTYREFSFSRSRVRRVHECASQVLGRGLGPRWVRGRANVRERRARRRLVVAAARSQPGGRVGSPASDGFGIVFLEVQPLVSECSSDC